MSKKLDKIKYIMIQGTMSNAGKSLIAAGLCRVFYQDGYSVAPFKSQNMALNSFITEDGLEMGRAQVMQAEAAGIKPSVYMNPILLKPTDDRGSQIIVNGRVVSNMAAREYFEYKKNLIPDIKKALSELEKEADIIVIEGAGSPAEINLKENDIVNMGMAKIVDAPVLLVGDIDRGGVFAQLLGTLELLEEDEKARIVGLIINKFRGDKTLLDSGIEMLESRLKKPVIGLVPYIRLNLEDEDSLSEKFYEKKDGIINIGIVKLPHISNFTDFDTFNQVEGVAINYLTKASQIDAVDMLILPGSKNTIEDMRYLRDNYFEDKIIEFAREGKLIMGICGGYQMLGRRISDPDVTEAGGSISGLGLLNVETVMSVNKYRNQTEGRILCDKGFLSELNGISFKGYEIHMGETKTLDDSLEEFTSDGTGYYKENVYGSYIHGLFDSKEMLEGIVKALCNYKSIDFLSGQYEDYVDVKDREYNKLAELLRESMDIDYIYKKMGIDRND